MGLVIGLFKAICFLMFCFLSGFALTLGSHESNVRIYYVFSVIGIVGVILLL